MISFIYFDVGGVVIKDFSASNKWIEMQQDLGITKDKEPGFIKFWDKYKYVMCADQDIDELTPMLASELGLAIPKEYSWLMDFVTRLESNKTIWPLLERLQSSTKIGLLTNMYPRMFGETEKAGLFPPIQWNVIVDSRVEKVQKPDAAIYELAETNAGVKPEEILFVDNVEKNLDPAKARGWQTFFYDSTDYKKSTQQLAELLQRKVYS